MAEQGENDQLNWPHEHTEGKMFTAGWTNYPEPANSGPVSAPSYQVIPVVKTPEIKPGEDILIDVYLAGYGKPDKSKLSIYHSYPGILPDHPTGEIVATIAGRVNWDENKVQSLYPGWSAFQNGVAAKGQLNKYGTTIALPTIFFADDPVWKDKLQNQGAPDEVFEEALPRTLSESATHGYAPIRIRYDTREDANPGDYQIYFTLTYNDEEATKNSQRKAKIRIMNKREILEPLPTFAIILATVIALISLIHQTGFINWFFDVLNTIRQLAV